MTDALSLFDDEPDHAAAMRVDAGLTPMTDSQRARIRDLFNELGVNDARGQFALVQELTGRPVNAVSDVSEADARRLILLLPGKIQSLRTNVTGNAWADRTEETWIDQL